MSLTGVLVGLLTGLALAWIAIVLLLLALRPKGGQLREATRLLPDLLQLLGRLATDRHLPRGVRMRLGLLLAFTPCVFLPVWRTVLTGWRMTLPPADISTISISAETIAAATMFPTLSTFLMV